MNPIVDHLLHSGELAVFVLTAWQVIRRINRDDSLKQSLLVEHIAAGSPHPGVEIRRAFRDGRKGHRNGHVDLVQVSDVVDERELLAGVQIENAHLAVVQQRLTDHYIHCDERRGHASRGG